MISIATLLSILYLIIGVSILSILVSYLLSLQEEPPKEKTTEVVVENPYWYKYPVWWGYGLPGWGGYSGGHGGYSGGHGGYSGGGGHHGGRGHGGRGHGGGGHGGGGHGGGGHGGGGHGGGGH